MQNCYAQFTVMRSCRFHGEADCILLSTVLDYDVDQQASSSGDRPDEALESQHPESALAAQGLLLSSLNLAARCSQEPKLARLAASCIEHACEGAVTASVDIPKDVIFGLVQAIQAETSDADVRLHTCLWCRVSVRELVHGVPGARGCASLRRLA